MFDGLFDLIPTITKLNFVIFILYYIAEFILFVCIVNTYLFILIWRMSFLFLFPVLFDYCMLIFLLIIRLLFNLIIILFVLFPIVCVLGRWVILITLMFISCIRSRILMFIVIVHLFSSTLLACFEYVL